MKDLIRSIRINVIPLISTYDKHERMMLLLEIDVEFLKLKHIQYMAI